MRVSTSRPWNSAGVQFPPCSAIITAKSRGPRDALGKVFCHILTKQIQRIAEATPGWWPIGHIGYD